MFRKIKIVIPRYRDLSPPCICFLEERGIFFFKAIMDREASEVNLLSGSF